MRNTYELTIKDVYGTDTPEISDGYEIVDFRPIREGDIILSTSKSSLTDKFILIDVSKPDRSLVRLILQKKPKPRRFEIELLEPVPWKNGDGLVWMDRVDKLAYCSVRHFKVIREIK